MTRDDINVIILKEKENKNTLVIYFNPRVGAAKSVLIAILKFISSP